MAKYLGEVILNNVLTKVEFECERGDQVNYLWSQYGMSTYIATVTEIESDDSEKLED